MTSILSGNQRTLAYLNYKFIMADNSQVWDGGLLRPFSSGRSCSRRKDVDRRNDADNAQCLMSSNSRIDFDAPKNLNLGSYRLKNVHQDKVHGGRRKVNQDQLSTTTASSRSNKGGNSKDKSILRQKHQPRHRSSSLNHSITGILRPSRYYVKCNDLQRRRASMPELSSMPASRSSCETLTTDSTVDVSSRSSDSWIPLGVDFCPQMEVYVFEKYE